MNLQLQSSQMPSSVVTDINEGILKVIKSMYGSTLSDQEFQVFCHVCLRTGLDPSRNQIYAIKRNDKENGTKMTIQTGIDGFRLIAERTGKYSPGREPVYSYDSTGNLVSATAFIKKQTTDGTWHEISATAFWSEYVQQFYDKFSKKMVVGKFWKQMPHGQLAKCAEALAIRKAFPADCSGLYTTEEMAQADNSTELQVSNIQDEEPITQNIIEKDFDEKELDEYLETNWKEHKDYFRDFMKEMTMNKKWSYRKCAETFAKYPDHTNKTFTEWKCSILM